MAHQWRCDLVGDATAEVEVPRRSAVENWQGRQQVDADRDRPPSLGSPRESSSREQIGDRVCLSMGTAAVRMMWSKITGFCSVVPFYGFGSCVIGLGRRA
jgi:hypothetical protein